MAEQTIDELYLKLSSDISKADLSFDNAIKSLEKFRDVVMGVSDELGVADASIDFFLEYYDKLEKEIKGRKIKIEVDTNGAVANIRKLHKMLSATIASSATSNYGNAKDLANSYFITDPEEIRKIEKEFDRVTNSVAKYGNVASASARAQKALEETIKSQGKFLSRNYDTYKQFYDEFKGKSFYISDAEKAALGSDYDKILKNNPFMISRTGGTSLNAQWSEITSKFKGFFSEDIVNSQDQILAFFNTFEEARRRIHPISYNDLFKEENRSDKTLANNVAPDVAERINQVIGNIQSTLRQVGEGGGFKYKVDFDIDEANLQTKLSNDLQRVVGQAFAQTEGMDISENAKSLTNYIKRFASIGQEDTSAVAGKLNTLASSLLTFANAIKGVTVPEGFPTIVKSIRSLAALQDVDGIKLQVNTTAIAEGIKRLITPLRSAGELDTKGVNSLAGIIKAFQNVATIDTAKAAQNIDKITEIIVKSIMNLNNSPAVKEDVMRFLDNLTKMRNGVKGLNSGLSNMGNRTLPSFGRGLKNLNKHGKNLLYTFYRIRGVIWAIRRLINMIGGNITYASDIVEQQNVVRNVFRESEAELEEFVNGSHETLKEMWSTQGWDTEAIPNAIERIGMNSLTIAQTASQFQAMGTAMGFPNDEMTDMSLRLTQLAGDMASFYNVDVADVSDDLRAIFTGMTKPMRQYGVDLTQATLKEYALSKGLDSNIQTMTQAEKTALRYQYVMERLAMVNGDFAATSDTWANQLRILQMNWKELGGVWGNIIINSVKPFIKALNAGITAAINFSETVANALGAIFGWTIEITQRGMLDPLADMEDYAEDTSDLADGLGGAADNAKALGKALTVLSFDELNQMNGDSSSGGSGSGGSGSSGSAASDAVSALDVVMTRVPTVLDKYKSEITNLFDLGRYISNAITTSLDSINWNAAYAKGSQFGYGLANFLNGLVTPEMFGEVGETIAGAINTALAAAYSFGTTRNWRQLGRSLVAGFNRFFATVDFKLAGATANTWANGILDGIDEAIINLDTERFGQALADFLGEIDTTKLFVKLVKIFGKVALAIVKALGQAILDLAEQNPMEAAILGIFSSLVITSKVKALATSIATMIGVGTTATAGGAAAGGLAAGTLMANVSSLVITAGAVSILAAGIAYLSSDEFHDAVMEVYEKVDGLISRGYSAETKDGVNPVGGVVKTADSFAGQLRYESTQKRVNSRERAANSRKYYDELTSAINKADDAEENLGSTAEKSGKSMIAFAEYASSYYSEVLRNSKDTAGKAVREITHDTANMMTVVWDSVKILGNAFDPVADGWENSMKHAFVGGGGAGGLINTIVRYSPQVDLAGKTVKDGLIASMNLQPGMEQVGTNAMTGLTTGWNTGKVSFFATVGKIGSETSTSVGDISASLAPKGQDAISGIMSGWNLKLPSLKNLAGSLKNTLKTSIGDTSDVMKPIGADVVSKITSGLTEGISSVTSKITNFANMITGNLPSVSELYNKGKSIFEGFASGVSSVYIKTPHFTQSTSLWDTIKDKLGNVVASLPKIDVSWWAKGGYFNGPNVIGVGEAGAEAVLPLTNRSTMSAIAESITKHGGVGLDRAELTQAVAEGYVRAMMANPTPPINVNAVLYTEDNEVLARAVNRGNRSISYRQNPTAAN